MAALPRPADPYRVLGVRTDATMGEIKDAHRRLAKRFHPDTAGNDPERFLAIQEAYQVLIDPLRRKEWDLHHAPGPVRAGSRGPDRRDRPSPRAAAPGRGGTRGERRDPGSQSPGGGSTPTPGTGPRRADSAAGPRDGETRRARGGPWSQSGRDPQADSYTWSARGVPWWESDAPPGSGKRQPGRRRPRAPADEAPADFEVFNRSSGAAWSSAARAHFRRSTSDMASGAAEPYATRWTTPDDGTTRIRRDPSAPGAARDDRSTPPEPTRGRRPASRPQAGTRPGTARSAFDTARSTVDPARSTYEPSGSTLRPVGAAVGTRSARRPSAVPSARPPTVTARPTAFRPPAPWPTLPERLVLAGLAWIPLALLVAFGGGALSGCDTASVGCPTFVPPLQAAALLALLLALLAFPRAAYLATGAGVGMIVAGLAALFLSAAGGALTFTDAAGGAVRSPSAMTAALVVAVMLAAYAVAGLVVWRDRPLRRPWLDRPLRRPARPATGPGPRP